MSRACCVTTASIPNPEQLAMPPLIAMWSLFDRRRAPRRSAVLSLLPLDATLFPGGRLALRVSEPRLIALAQARVDDGARFGVVTRTATDAAGRGFAAVGTAARIRAHEVASDGAWQLDVVGEDRFEIVRSSLGRSGLHHAGVRWIRPEPRLTLPVEYRELGRLLARLVEQHPSRFAEPIALDDAGWVGSRLAEVLQIPIAIKQGMLEINDAALRLKTIAELLGRGHGAGALDAP